MDIAVDPTSEIAIYQQIRDRVVEAIAAGALRPGTALASVRTLASAFAINPATVAKAYDLLRSEGLVTTNRKSGSVVARDHDSGPPPAGFVDDWSARLLTLLAEGRARGLADDNILTACRDRLASFTATPTEGTPS